MPLRRLLIACLLTLLPHAGRAEPALLERYDGPTTSWSPVPNRFGVRVLAHERVRQDDQRGTGAELVRLTGPPGYSGLLLTPIGHAPILEDLQIEVRLRTDHPGVQLGVRVVFPRETDPNTGRSLVSIVRGDDRALGVRDWETLTLSQAPATVRRHARAVGSSLGHSIDERGAYADAVVLIVPCDPQGAALWIDELKIEGLVRSAATSGNPDTTAEQAPPTPRRVRLTQEGLLIDDRPYFPRVITHYGESLPELKKLGFNTIAFESTPTEELRDECGRLGLQLICPPPPTEELTSPATAAPWDGVLAWLLPDPVDEHSLDATAAVAETLRQNDTVLNRPVLARPTEAWGAWSRLADGLVVDAPWAPPARMLDGCKSRFTAARRFARPGAPLLAAIPLTHSDAYLRQVTAFAPAGTVDTWRAPTDVIAEATAASTDGARGVWITRNAAFTGAEGDERVRQGMALLNLNLTLLEPWLRDGRRAGEIAAREPGRSAVVMSRGRTRLLIPRLDDPITQSPQGATYIVPGVAEAAKAYEFTLVGMRPLALNRLAGGAHVNAGDPAAWVLITEDARSAAEVGQRVRSVSRRAEALQQSIAVAELRHAEAHLSPLVLAAGSRSPDAAVLADARRKISLAKSAESTGDISAAFAHAAEATTQLARWSRDRVAAANAVGPLDSSPLAVQASTIIDHYRLLQLIEPLSRRANLLPAGDFEDHTTAAASGWRHIARDAGASQAVVSFAGAAPPQGARCLRIECPADDAQAPAAASVEISSPGVNLETGQLVEVTGMVRVESADRGGQLVLTDNLGGEELSVVLDRPTSWRPFRLLRRALQDGPLQVTFAANGPITAELDAVMVRPVELPSAAKAAVLGAPALQRK